MPEYFSDELLNAYVDGELDQEDRERIEQAMEQDETLRARVDELLDVKKLVASAYADAVPRREGVPPRVGWQRLNLMVAASIAAFAFGVAVTLGVLTYTGVTTTPRVAQAPGTDAGSVLAAENAVKAMFHLSRNSPEQLRDILNEAEALLITSKRMGKPVSVRILASGAGLALLEQDAAVKAAQRISEMKKTYRKQLTFNGCGLAYKQFRSRSGKDFELIPEVELVDLGVLELMRRQRDGWAYIRL